MIPLLILFEFSILLSVLMERRWNRGFNEDYAAGRRENTLGGLGGPVEGPPIRDGAVPRSGPPNPPRVTLTGWRRA